MKSHTWYSSAETLIHAFISSHLDCFNSLLYGVPDYELNKLQRIQNSAARLISGCRKFDHITPTLITLHWLPVKYRIDYKILVLTYKALKGFTPGYINDLLSEKNPDPDLPLLRNNDIVYLTVPKMQSAHYGEHSFSYAAPHLWNSLPVKCKKASSLFIFKGLLKTHLFNLAYNV